MNTISYELEQYFQLMKERPQDFLKSEILDIITDTEVITSYEKQHPEIKIGLLYRSKFHMLVVDLVKDGKNIFPYERILDTVTGGNILFVMHNEKILLVKQFRHALREYQLSCPRGFREAGLSSLDNTKKELHEELALENEKISYKYLGTTIADSGLDGNKVDIYLCQIINDKKKINSKITEGITESVEVTEQEFLKLVAEGKITDGFTVSAYTLFKAKA